MNELEHAFSDPQALARNMKVDVPLVGGGTVSEPGNPIKMSETYQDTYTAPPLVGQDTVAVLREFAKLDDAALDDLKARHIIGVATSD